MRSSTILPSHARREHEFQKNARESVEHSILHFHSLNHNATLAGISTYISCSKRTVQRALKSLLEQGVIKKTKRFSPNGVCMATIYEHCHTERLSQCQSLQLPQKNKEIIYMDATQDHRLITEQLSQCQDITPSSRARNSSNNIYNIYNNNPISSNLESINHAHEEQTGGQGEYDSYKTKKTGRIMVFDEGRVAFYQLLFEFLKEGGSHIRCDIDYKAGSETHGILGTICEDLEFITRSVWRQYARSHKLSFEQLRTRLLSLAALIRSGKAFQCKALEGISLNRLMTQRGLFSTMMEESIGFRTSAHTLSTATPIPNPEIKITNDVKLHQPESPPCGEDELKKATIDLYSKLGMDPSFMLKNLGIT